MTTEQIKPGQIPMEDILEIMKKSKHDNESLEYAIEFTRLRGGLYMAPISEQPGWFRGGE